LIFDQSRLSYGRAALLFLSQSFNIIGNLIEKADALRMSQCIENKKAQMNWAFVELFCSLDAEAEGFEPPVPCGTPVFKTGAIDQLCQTSKRLQI
jgi:hypothetical protein